MNLQLQILYMLIFSSMVAIYTAMTKPDSYLFDPDVVAIATLVLCIDVTWLLMVIQW